MILIFIDIFLSLLLKILQKFWLLVFGGNNGTWVNKVSDDVSNLVSSLTRLFGSLTSFHACYRIWGKVEKTCLLLVPDYSFWLFHWDHKDTWFAFSSSHNRLFAVETFAQQCFADHLWSHLLTMVFSSSCGISFFFYWKYWISLRQNYAWRLKIV